MSSHKSRDGTSIESLFQGDGPLEDLFVLVDLQSQLTTLPAARRNSVKLCGFCGTGRNPTPVTLPMTYGATP